MAPPPPLPSLKRTTRDVAEIYSSTPWNIPSSADREFTGRYCPCRVDTGVGKGTGGRGVKGEGLSLAGNGMAEASYWPRL